MTDAVADFLSQYGRNESELLGPDQLQDPGIYAGEREYIELAEADYYIDKHWIFEITASDCALIVIDMQEDFVEPGRGLFIPEALRQVPRILRTIDVCRRLSVPVLYTEYTAAQDVAHDFYRIWPAIKAGACAEGTRGARLHRAFRPTPGERVVSTKHSYDAFEGTNLDYALRNQGVKTLIICGTQTNYCCESTARSGYFRGYHIVFGSDINSADNAYAQNATLRTLRRGFGRVLDHKQIVNILDNGDSLYREAVAARG